MAEPMQRSKRQHKPLIDSNYLYEDDFCPNCDIQNSELCQCQPPASTQSSESDGKSHLEFSDAEVGPETVNRVNLNIDGDIDSAEFISINNNAFSFANVQSLSDVHDLYSRSPGQVSNASGELLADVNTPDSAGSGFVKYCAT